MEYLLASKRKLREVLKLAKARNISRSLVCIGFMLANIYGQHANVFISQANEPNEPTIAIDIKNPLRLVAGSNQNNVYLSEDGGRTWSENELTSRFNVRGDPCVTVDTTGSFYFFHLSDSISGQGYFLDRIVCQRLDSLSKAWTPGTGIGFNSNSRLANQDKEWAMVDPNSNAIYVTWTQFDRYRGTDPQDSSNILFSKSTDKGETWSSPIRINEIAGRVEDGDNTVEGAVPAVGPEGQIYVSWAGPAGLRFDRSLDGGVTWMAKDVLIDPMPGGWDFNVPGLFRANGFPTTAADLGKGPFRGNIYVCWSDQSLGSTDTEIWLKKSLDGGLTWTAKSRVNNDGPGHHQFFPWMALDQSTGYLWIVFYDRRGHVDNSTDVYLACSKDGGNTFQNVRISQTSFVPQPAYFLGDYLNISASQGVVRPIWMRMDSVSGSWVRSVWTALVDTGNVGVNSVSIRYFAKSGINLTGRWSQFVAHSGFARSRGDSYYDMLGRWLQTDPNLKNLSEGNQNPRKKPGRYSPGENGRANNRTISILPIAWILLMGIGVFAVAILFMLNRSK